MQEPAGLHRIGTARADVLAAAFRAHYLGLVRLAVQLVDDQAAAEDVVQDVFARLQRSTHNLHSVENLRRYLVTAVVNQARSVHRHRRVVRSTLLDVVEHVDGADAAALRNATSAVIWQTMACLPTRQRQVVVLRYYEEWSIGEIADALGISRGAASSSLERALKSLKKVMGALDEQR
jgi:RNA polymerase sigma factor (sigma-70 family)